MTDAAEPLPKPSVTNQKLKNIVDDLDRGTINPGRVGTDMTADAVHNEQPPVCRRVGSSTAKAQDDSNALDTLLNKQDLDHSDQVVARSQRAMRLRPSHQLAGRGSPPDWKLMQPHQAGRLSITHSSEAGRALTNPLG